MRTFILVFLFTTVLFFNSSKAQFGGGGCQFYGASLSGGILPYQSNAQTLSISSSRCLYVVTGPSWMTLGRVTPTTGGSDYAVTFDENTGYSERSGFITISENGQVVGSINVKQQGKPCTPNNYTVSGATTNVCQGTSRTISLSGSESGVNYTLKRNGSTVSTKSGTGSGLSWNVSLNTSGACTYTVVATRVSTSCSRTMSGSVSFTVNPTPSTPSASNQSNCYGVTINLTASAGANGNQVRWYKSNGDYIGTKTSHSVYVTKTESFSVRTYNSSTGCISSPKTVTSSMKPKPSVPTNIVDDVACANETVQLSASPGGGGDQVKWYSNSGSYIKTGTSYTPTLSSTTSYKVKTYNSLSGCYSSEATVTATVNPKPSTPVSLSGDTRCGAGTVTLSAAPGSNGNQVRWYNSAGTHKYSGNTYSHSLSSTHTYSVKTYNTSTGCYSSAASVTGTINPIPSAPVSLSGDSRCGSGVVNLSASTGANGNQVRWYNSAGTLQSTNNAFSPDLPSTENFNVKSYNTSTGCISSAASVTGTINAIPSSPVSISGDTRCGSGTVTLSAAPGSNGNQVRWYNSAGTHKYTGNSYAHTLSSTHTYSVKTYNTSTGCYSSAASVTGTINPIPSAPVSLSGDSRCGSGVVNLSASTGANGNQVRWYNSAGTLQSTNNAFSPDLPSTETFNVKSYNTSTGCISSAASVTGTINAIPSSPVSISGDTRCGSGTVTLSAAPGSNGNQVRWYNSAGTHKYTGNSYAHTLSSTHTYSVKTYNTSSGCISSAASVTGTINPIPSAPVSLSGDSRCGSGVVNLSAAPGSNGNQVQWFNSAGTLQSTNNAYSPDLPSTETFNVKTYNTSTGCISSAVPVTGTIDIVPGIPSASNMSSCFGETIALTAVPGTNGTDVNWYTSAEDYIDTKSTHNVYVDKTESFIIKSLDAATGCESAAKTVVSSMRTKPAIPNNIVEGAVCGQGEVNLSASPGNGGDIVKWYNAAGTEIHSGTTYSENLTSTKTYTAKTYSSFAECYSEGVEIEGKVNPIPLQPTAQNVSFCNGDAVSLSAMPGDYGNQINWYSSDGNLLISNTNYEFVGSQNENFNAKTVNTNTGCESEAINVLASLKYTPELKILPNNSNINIGEDITLSVEGFEQVEWFDNAMQPLSTNSSYSLTPLSTKTLNVVGTYINGCKVQASKTVSVSKNYLKHTKLLQAINDPSDINLDETKKNVSVKFYNGLGRPMQTIQLGMSPDGNDIIQHIEYDEFGRESKKYLPYVDTEEAPEIYRLNTRNATLAYYASEIEGKNATDSIPYSEVLFENSPLNRVLATTGVGESWQTKPVTYDYKTNSSAVRTWDENGDEKPYEAGSLYISEVSDENGNITREYKNVFGQVILKESLNEGESLQTYYVYDDYGLLRTVVPPLAGSPSEVELCYFYEYDHKKRMISKKLPGAEKVYMVYDKRDRLVLVQDGNMRNESTTGAYKYNFTRYDEYNRPVLTGELVTPVGLDSIRSYFNNNETYIPYEEYVGSGNYGYTSQSYPGGIIVTTSDVKTATWYDNYNFIGDLNLPSNFAYHTADLPAGFNTNHTNNVNGLVTGSMVAAFTIDGSGHSLAQNKMHSVSYYDDYGNAIQTISQNHRGGFDIVSSQYQDLTFWLKQMQQQHIVNNNLALSILESYSYDHAGRLLSTTHKINDQEAVVLNSMEYNQLGELIEKGLHSTDGVAFTQNINYTYNIRGWLTQINDPVLADNDVFGMKLFYNNLEDLDNTTTTQPQYNGNIAAIKYSAVSDTVNGIAIQRGYGFTYDKLNRLTEARYAEGGTLANNKGLYSMSAAYDQNGNIDSLYRYFEGNLADQLQYTYAAGSNQLLKVEDPMGDMANVEDYVVNHPGNYDYDANGNMIFDAGKNANVSYNALNLPKSVSDNSNPNVKIFYHYDAAGRKLAKTNESSTSSVDNVTDYVGNIIYENDEIAYLITNEGRMLPLVETDDTTWKYEYSLKDHLGNSRVIIAGALQGGNVEILQESHYYPFGLVFKTENYPNSFTDYTKNKYLYNGKELQSDQLTGRSLNWYDYGARMYDAAIGRWHCQDELAEKYIDVSPYNYVLNNPINAFDPDGRLVIFATGYATKMIVDKYPPDFEFTRNEPYMNGNPFSAYGKDNWQGLDKGFERLFNDNNSYHIYGGHYGESTAADRFNRGRFAAKHFNAMVFNGDIKLGENETIKIVGHSHGAAFSAGLATQLMEQGYSVEYVYYVAAHQPTDFEHPDGATGVQLIRRSDWVSSDQGLTLKGALLSDFSPSKFGKIKGITSENFIELRDYPEDEGRGGHNTWTFVEELANMVLQAGGTVNVVE